MAHVLKSRSWASERGAEVIEFAIVLPLLLLVVFGIVDFGFLFQRYVVLTNAAMEGARVRVLPGYADPDAIARATAYAVDGGIPNAGTCPPYCVGVTPVNVPNASGGTWPAFQVSVNYIHQYSYIGPIAQLFGGNFTSVTLRAQSTMRSQVAPAGGS
jgi:Flp pilus assembly protein TadG